MSAFKLQTLKQKLWSIVAASFIARVVVFFALPNTPSSLGPDEKTYASLVKWVGESKIAKDFPIYGEGLYLSGRSLITPANFLYRAGLNELDAVRLVSALYGLSTLILLVIFTLNLYTRHSDNQVSKSWNTNLLVGIFLVFAFLPSHFVWSNLGLRESATEFWLVTSFLAFFYILHRKENLTFPGTLILFGSIVLTFSARPQVGWVLIVSLTMYLCLNLKTVKTFFLIPIVLSAALFGGILNSGSSVSSVSRVEILLSALSPLTNAAENVEFKHEANQDEAASVIKTQSCPIEKNLATNSSLSKFDTYFCIIWRAPYMASTFMFRPLIGFDTTSFSSLLAAIENLFWLLLFLIPVVYGVRKRGVSFFKSIFPGQIFLILYTFGASAYQGNMGTAFRHKSLILWAVLLLIFALAWKKPKAVLKELGNNSQESAV